MEKVCKKCGNKLNEEDKFCQQCGSNVEESNITSNNNVQSDNNQNDAVNTKSGYNPSAIGGFVCSLVGLIIFGIVMGIIAISLGIAAKQHFKVFTNEKGEGLAIAAIIIGCIDIVFPIISIIINVGKII